MQLMTLVAPVTKLTAVMINICSERILLLRTQDSMKKSYVNINWISSSIILLCAVCCVLQMFLSEHEDMPCFGGGACLPAS